MRACEALRRGLTIPCSGRSTSPFSPAWRRLVSSEPSENVKQLLQAALDLDPDDREELDSLVFVRREGSDRDTDNATKVRAPTREAEVESPTRVRSRKDPT